MNHPHCNPEHLNTKCPNCGSGSTQSAKMVIASGTRSWQGNSVSSGLQGNVRFGASFGSSQTALASMLDPGARPSYISVLCLAVFSFAVSLNFPNDVPLLNAAKAFFFLIFIPVWLLRRRFQRQNWNERMGLLDHSWVCRKCGWQFEAARG